MATTPRTSEHSGSHAPPTIEASNQAHKPVTPEQKAAAAKERGANVQRIEDEQRTRSAEIEAMGVDNWVSSHDERPEDEHWVPTLGQISAGGGAVMMRPPDKGKQVQGVAIKQPADAKL